MRSFTLLLLLGALAAPLSAQAPSDYEAAVSARQAGEPREAVILLDRWLAEHPADSDALVQRGFAYLALEQRTKAADDFRAALILAPDYADARDGLARALRREENAGLGYIIAGGAWSDISGGAADWSEASLDVAAPVSTTATLGGRAVWHRRFGAEDVELVGRAALHPADDIWLRVSAGGTPSADFRPEIAVAVGADYRVTKGSAATVISLDAAYQRFPLQDVIIINPGVVRYFAGGKAWGTLRGIGTIADGGNLQVGALARIDYAPGTKRRFFAGIANGPDTDLGIVTRVTSVFGGAEFPLGADLSVLPSIAHDWRENGGERTEFRLELKAGF